MSRALSIKQPWAWLIVNGHKTIENRSWMTRHRGRLLIHAGQRIDYAGYQWVQQHMPHIKLPARSDLQTGGIVGEVTVKHMVALQDCKQLTAADKPWHMPPAHAWVLEDGKPLPFTACRGMLGLFTPTY